MSVINMNWEMPRRLSSADPLLLAPVAVLLALSIVMVFSAAIGTHGGIGGGMTVLAKHLFGIVLGLAVGAAAACLPLSLWQRSTRLLFALGAGLLGADGGPVERTLDGGLQVTVGCTVWRALVE